MTLTAPIIATILVSVIIPALAFNYALNRINPLSSSSQLRNSVLRLVALSLLSVTYLLAMGYFFLIDRAGITYGPALLLAIAAPAVLGGLWRTAVNRGQVAE